MRSTKVNRFAIVFLIIGVLVLIVVWWTRHHSDSVQATAQRMLPKLTLATMNITDITPETIKMKCGLQISNPLPLNLKADSLQYEVWIDSVRVVREMYPKAIAIGKRDNGFVILPVEIKSATLRRLIEKFDARKTDSADYTVKTSFSTHIPVAGKRHFDIHVTKRLPAIRKVTIKPEKIDLDKLGFKNSQIALQLSVQNDNAFPVDITNGKYFLNVEQDLEMEGTLEKNLHIPARGSADVDLRIDIKTAKVPSLGWKMLFHKNKSRYNLRFTGKLKSDAALLNNSVLNMKVEGTLEDIKDMAKTK